MLKKVEEVTDGTIQEFLHKHTLAVIDFWNPMCGPCNKLTPVIEELATEYAGRCVFGKMNVGKNGGLDPYLRQKYLDGQGVPVLLFYKNGERADRILGYYPEITLQKIKNIINHLIE